MRPHHIVISAGIFIMCWLVLGLRGLDAGVIGVVTFLGGVRVGHKEEEVATGVTRLKDKFVAWFN